MRPFRLYARAAWKLFRHRYVSFVFRLAGGILLVVSGSTKVAIGGAFAEEVAKVEEATGVQFLPGALTDFYAMALPWVEIVVGALLILGVFSRVAAGVGALTVLSFIIANGVILYRGLNLECPCFGEAAELHTREAIIIDSFLFAMALQILVHKGDFLSLGSKVGRLRP